MSLSNLTPNNLQHYIVKIRILTNAVFIPEVRNLMIHIQMQDLLYPFNFFKIAIHHGESRFFPTTGVFLSGTATLFGCACKTSHHTCQVDYDIRGEGKIEKVFVLDVHCFIRKIEDFVGWKMLRSLSLETRDRCSLILWLTKL